MAKERKDSATEKLEGEALERLRDARRWKELWVIDFIECYFFAMPHRQRMLYSTTKPPVQRMLDAPELQTSLGFELCGDFVTEVVNTYMPEAQKWCERGRGMYVTQKQFKAIEKSVREQDDQIFEAIRASNFYSELPKSYNPDLAIGTVGLWIDVDRPGRPIQCTAVPLREIEVNMGPGGLIDDRFAVRHIKTRYVKAHLPKDAVISADLQKRIDKKPDDTVTVSKGFWRMWDKEDDEWWQHVVTVDNELVHQAEIKGEGCCPLIVSRWNPTADWPWGYGSLIQTLPDLRQKDELEGRVIDIVDRNLDPPMAYPDDSFAQVEQGLENGMAYPVRVGSEDAIKPIYPQTNIDTALLKDKDMEHRARKLFYVDYPEQSGDTPPTLGQWLDELARAQRRIGTPGLGFWREGPAEYFLRFKYLLEKQGTLAPIKVDGKSVSLRPYNPTQRAAEQQEIATAAQFAQMMAQMFPEEWRMVIDGRQTMEAFMTKMRVSGLIKFRDQKHVDDFVKQIAPLIMGRERAGAPALQGGLVPAAGKPQQM